MMTTPRVTEIPIAMAAVEPDSFIEDSSRGLVAHRRRAEREDPRKRRTELVRRTLRSIRAHESK